MSAAIRGTFTKNDVKIVFYIDEKPRATYFSEQAMGNLLNIYRNRLWHSLCKFSYPHKKNAQKEMHALIRSSLTILVETYH